MKGKTMNKILKPQRIDISISIIPARLAAYHNDLCTKWEDYIKQSDHKRLTKLFDEYKRDYRIVMEEVNKAFTKQMIEECTGDDIFSKLSAGRTKSSMEAVQAIRNAMLKRLGE